MRPRLISLLDGWTGVSIFSWIVPTPAIVYMLATVGIVIVFLRRSRMAGLSAYHAAGVALWATICAFLGARAFYLLQHLSETVAAPEQVWQIGGICSWGAYLGVIAALFAYTRIHEQDSMAYADILASCAGLGLAIGRISCFLNGDDFGTLSHLPWAVRFPHASMPFVWQVREDLLSPTANLSLPVHPVQLYFSLMGLVLFGVGTLYWCKFRDTRGLTFWSYLLVYSFGRFALEYARADQDQHVLGLTVPQLMAVITATVAVLVLMKVSRGYKIIANAAASNISIDG